MKNTTPDPLASDAGAVLAKSDGKTLLGHIEDCLTVYRGLRAALPSLPRLTGLENFFELLFCAVYLHDWGKAHNEFQKLLRKDENHWCNNRHELFSVPFTEMLPYSESENRLIALAILGHHKDFETLLDYLPTKAMLEEYRDNPPPGATVNPLDFNENLQKQLNVPYLAALRDKMETYFGRFTNGERRFKLHKIDFSSIDHPVKALLPSWLDQPTDPDDPGHWQQMFLAGATRICDHMGSAEIEEIPVLTPDQFTFLDRSDIRWYPHQQQCAQMDGNLFLTAPTGSGKTEAALLWLRKQIQAGCQGRTYYVLPYTASINAMHRRLIKDFEGEDVSPADSRLIGILHGRLAQYLAEYFEEDEEAQEERAARIALLKDMNRQMVHPLKVVTPFQILKYFYGVKGFEKGFTELAGAMLIFDEIHAYDTRTFAQIATALSWLRRHMDIRVMIMTATFPEFMRKEMEKAVGQIRSVHADEKLLEEFTRHEVRLVDGTIYDRIDAIRQELKSGRRVIVVCNTVANAQKMFMALGKKMGDRAVLLHSRFTYRDRMDKEKRLFDTDVRLLVGTQAIEVSLDIDFDVMFTEPAPLDALIQRFGRINRKRKKGICLVYVCRQGGEKDPYIYPPEIVNRTLAALKNVSLLKERNLQHMLDTIYPDWLDKRLYETTKSGFLDSLTRLRPFMRHQEVEQEFYKRFTGVEVLPACFAEAYERHIEHLDFINAERLMVSLHRGAFWKLRHNGLIEKSAAVTNRRGRLGNHSYWLAACEYTGQLGLLDKPAPMEKNVSVQIF
jgi:CRISPR-associated endonuclease/helicase Cas3